MKISIIGAAGTVGSGTAFDIGIHHLANELVMIDDHSPDKLEQYANDLSTAVAGLDTLVRAGIYEDMRDSDIVIMSAGSSQVRVSRLEVLPQNLPIIRDVAGKIRQFCPESIVITATNPVCPLNYAMHLASGLDRRRLIGYAANDSVRFRMFLARALGVKTSQVEATVIGEHGNTQVPLFSSVRVDGHTVTLSENIKQQVRLQVAHLPQVLEGQRAKSGRTQGWASSVGLTYICRAIVKDSGRIIPSSIVLDGEYGYRGLSMSVPAAIGKEGIRYIHELELDPEEQEGLEISVQTLMPHMRFVEQYLGFNVGS